jgi:hypothetical protein
LFSLYVFPIISPDLRRLFISDAADHIRSCPIQVFYFTAKAAPVRDARSTRPSVSVFVIFVCRQKLLARYSTSCSRFLLPRMLVDPDSRSFSSLGKL